MENKRKNKYSLGDKVYFINNDHLSIGTINKIKYNYGDIEYYIIKPINTGGFLRFEDQIGKTPVDVFLSILSPKDKNYFNNRFIPENKNSFWEKLKWLLK